MSVESENRTGEEVPFEARIAVDLAADDNNGLPTEYALYQNYPNPFNPVTTIRYSVPFRENVTLLVYDILGSQVRTLVKEIKEAGEHDVSFYSEGLSSGIYFYKLTAGDFSETKKLQIVK